MTGWHPRIAGLALVTTLCLAPPAGEAKQNRSGVSQCRQRVAALIRADHPRSRGSSFSSGVQRDPLGNNAVAISGWGRVRTAQGKHRDFSYSCVYNHRNGKLSKVKYELR